MLHIKAIEIVIKLAKYVKKGLMQLLELNFSSVNRTFEDTSCLCSFLTFSLSFAS